MDAGGLAPALQASALGFRVGGMDILAGVDLRVARGELVGVIGPNGAGKTTLLNVVTGLLQPSSGQISLGGIDLARLTPAHRTQLGLGRTFQTSSLFPTRTAFEHTRLAAQLHAGGNLRFWHRHRRDDGASQIGRAALAAVGMENLASRPAGALSHGDKRKLELAILIAGGADVLLLDEPMAGVNAEDVPALTELISKLHDDGRTILLVEHHMGVVLGLAQRVAVLHHGRLLACGQPAAVIADETVQAAYLGTPL